LLKIFAKKFWGRMLRIRLEKFGLSLSDLRGFVKREFEGKALKWGCAPHPILRSRLWILFA
jgi:hypothetical protein